MLVALAVLAVVISAIRVWNDWPRREPPTPREALFMILLPEAPRTGKLDRYTIVLFENVLVTKRTESDRVLRFYLSMPEREFVSLTDFQEIYHEHPSIHTEYHSNPLDLPNNTQKVLAFVLAPGSEGVADTFELLIHDVHSDEKFMISDLGEYVCYDDGSSGPVSSGSAGR